MIAARASDFKLRGRIKSIIGTVGHVALRRPVAQPPRAPQPLDAPSLAAGAAAPSAAASIKPPPPPPAILPPAGHMGGSSSSDHTETKQKLNWLKEGVNWFSHCMRLSCGRVNAFIACFFCFVLFFCSSCIKKSFLIASSTSSRHLLHASLASPWQPDQEVDAADRAQRGKVKDY